MIPALLLAASLLAAGEPGPTVEPVRPARPRGVGTVTYVTAAHVYLDAGAEDGLVQGQMIELRREGVPVGACEVETLAPHRATCTGARARPGDRFRFDAAPEPAPAKLLPAPPSEDELARRLAAVTAAPPMPLLQAKVPPPAAQQRVDASRVAEVALTDASYVSSGSGPSHRDAVDVLIRGADLGRGLVLDVDARAEHWFRREQPVFRPRNDSALYVWQAQITAAPTDALVLSAGRIMPWAIPGATVFDGASAGYRGSLLGGRSEVGVFGGLVPEPDTTAPTTRRSTGGGYWLIDGSLGKGASYRQEGRVAVVNSPELGTRVEGSLTGAIFLKRFDLSGEANLGGGGKVKANGLDSGRVDATFRPVGGLAIGGSFRYAGVDWPQPFNPPVYPGNGRAGDAFVSYDLVRWLRLGATGGLSHDATSGLDRKWVGPEVALPRLLGDRGGVSFGYLQEVGWVSGQSAYGQIVARPWQPVRLLARVSWTHDKGAAVDTDEVGLFASAAAELSKHLGLRLSLSSRAGFDREGGEGGSVPYGLTAFGTVYASY